MARSLLEAYSKRINIAESVYKKANNGRAMDNHRKLVVARCLANTNKFLNEAFDSSIGTQRSEMGLFKKFCMNLTNIALPNLIANDLVLTYPMTSMSGYITYLKYTIGQSKGDLENGRVLRTPWQEGDLNSNGQATIQSEYTSAKVTQTLKAETVTVTDEEGSETESTVYRLRNVKDFAPALNTVSVVDAEGTTWRAKSVNGTTITLTDAEVAFEVERNGNVERVFAETTTADKTITVAKDGTLSGDADLIADGVKVSYVYNNIVVPQAALPTVKAEMEAMPLLAKARRIAVFYSQIAAFQAKQDYGFDLGDQLAEQAVGQLAYEIDTEIVEMLRDNAAEDDKLTNWSTVLPVGVNKRDHYEGFAEIVEMANQILYERTLKFAATYMVCAPSVVRILTFINGFNAAPKGKINGPYLAGTLNGLKVFVSPALKDGRFFFGVNGDDMMSSAAVYAPYMPVVPTQLLQYADGGTSQGWSTLYDLKMLNKNLLVAGRIDDKGINTYMGHNDTALNAL